MKKFFVFFVFISTIICQSMAWAAPLVYSQQQESFSDQQNVGTQPGQTTAVPVGYSTNYDNQFAPYSSFMQPPPGAAYSNGSMMQQYPQQIRPMYASAPMSPVQTDVRDPYQAAEVSPFAHYSPYLEVIGQGGDYTLGVDDVLTIIVRNQPDFSGRFVVDPNGNIQYNFVGDVPAEGKTKEEVKVMISEELKKFIRYPEVAVMISEYKSKNVYVFGYVNRPGKYAMKGNRITLKEAIVAAGLPREDGSLQRVYVVRPSEFTENGEAAKKKVNLKDLLQKGDSAEDFILEPGDTVIVHQRYFDRFVNAFSRLVGPVFQSAALYEMGWGNGSTGIFRKK